MLQTDKQTNKQTDSSGCRVATATKNFTITPAESDQSPQCGGGGAGILINSKGPRYGYGGGGEGCSKANPSGGAIMIEIGD